MSELARLDEDDAPRALALVPARADTDSWTTVVAHVARLAQEVAGTSFVPKGLRNDVPATTAAILYGREVGLPPMTALTQIHVIEGRPGMAAEGMRALVLAAGHEIIVEESTGALCRMRARRRGSSTWTPLVWTLDMARAAGLLGKDNWRHYPRAMLVARCSADLCRMIFPDVIHGFRSIEELDDMGVGSSSEEPTTSTTAVQRRRSRKRAAAVDPPPAAASEPPSSSGPPLPGEEGYQDASAADTPSRPSAADAGDSESSADPPNAPPPVPATGQTDAPGPRMVNRPTLRFMFREFNRLGVDDAHREKRLRILGEITGREIESSAELTQDEATRVLTMLGSSKDLDALRVIVDTTAVEDLPENVDEPLPDPEPEEGKGDPS